MTDENAEIVRRFYASWARQDLEGVSECVHSDVEIDWSGSLSPFRGIYRGPDGLGRALNEIMDAWEKFVPEIEDVIECGPDRLITPTLVRGQGKGSGAQGEAHGAVLWTMRDGKILQGKLFQSKKEALEAVGLGK